MTRTISIYRNPYHASFLSIIVPGLGFLYITKNEKFIFIYVLSLISSLVMILSTNIYLFYIFMIISIINLLYGIVYSFIETHRLKSIDPARLKSTKLYLVLILVTFVSNFFLISYSSHTVYSLPSVDMEPTLIKNKRFHVKTNNIFDLDLNYGDIIVFKYKDSVYAKRLIAMPDDSIKIKDSNIILNGTKLSKKRIGEFLISEDFYSNNIIADLYEERIYQFQYNIIDYVEQSSQDNTKKVQLNSHQYFVLGDNRDNSWDSRSFGPILEKQIIGKVVSTYLPFM